MYEDTDGDEMELTGALGASSKRFINLANTVEDILRQILTFGAQNEQHTGSSISTSKQSKMQDFDLINDDEDIKIIEGVSLPRSVFAFKGLLMDTNSQKVVGPIMKVYHLRECNILFHQGLA